MTEEPGAPSRQGARRHTAADVESAIGGLDSRGIERLHTAARNSLRRYGLDGLARDHEDLLSEVFIRLLSGKRKWRRGVGFEYQVARMMDSIASDWRRRDTATPEVREVELRSPDDDGKGVASPLAHLPAPKRSIEDRMVAVARVREITNLFADDPAALQVLECFYQELSREQMRERTGMSEKQLAATIRRIRRKAEKLR